MIQTQAAPPARPRVRQFKTVQQFWDYHDQHPEAFHHMDATAIVLMARQVSDRAQERERNGSKTASNNGTKREETGASRAPHALSEELGSFLPLQGRERNGSKTASSNGTKREETGGYRVGPGNPPIEHRFKPGNPGGPGAPIGPKSMRKLIRALLFDEETGAKYAKAITAALFRRAMEGNTHAIRIIVENGNNRPKRKA